MEIFLQTIGALHDETRIKLLRFIEQHRSVCIYELEQVFEMIQSYISPHFKILKEISYMEIDHSKYCKACTND
ncbi:ArsR family transcriptional regulator [Sulfurovum sp. zt1-1]|uniref:ArsR family transcriptional regulator n=1 Tax=Sulfurovum zhangzhouensis TaxID=3019067 RepID=A0ABT7QY32_9BACT|nr:ArsR family transcriptional regulator [Sulfurovum zhangzhouensis]MDM5271735.1 ArsR family transcriptional regulator [Sulfurovum zhangzhouensis]